ncbi:MAG TPA: transporter [Micromonosporaceae bacterium]|nr:transporter [Micromonosporaceae bacterium]
MIWLAWRQHHKQALFTLIGLVVLAALMIPTGLAMRHTFAHLGLPACVRALGHAELVPANNETCGMAFNRFRNQYDTLTSVGVLFLVLPLLVGLFWGAPLVAREIEHGTHRLVWTQAVSRRHWALVKFGLVGTATLATAVVYGLGMSWWLTPLSQAGQSRFDPFLFDMQGLVPIGYTLFAVALGIFAGTIWPKMLAAMAATLAGFLGLRIALAVFARPRFLPARVLTYPVQGVTAEPNPTVGDWVLRDGVRDSSGKLVAANSRIACPENPTGPGADCGRELGIGPGAYNWQLYQPGSRFWLFQSIETGIFVGLAALLLYLAVRRIRRIA